MTRQPDGTTTTRRRIIIVLLLSIIATPVLTSQVTVEMGLRTHLADGPLASRNDQISFGFVSLADRFVIVSGVASAHYRFNDGALRPIAGLRMVITNPFYRDPFLYPEAGIELGGSRGIGISATSGIFLTRFPSDSLNTLDPVLSPELTFFHDFGSSAIRLRPRLGLRTEIGYGSLSGYAMYSIYADISVLLIPVESM
jgi:hypothetical protein